MKFRAAVLRSHETPFAVEEIVLSTGPAAGEILVEIAGCGMCRTDLAVRHSVGRTPLPHGPRPRGERSRGGVRRWSGQHDRPR